MARMQISIKRKHNLRNNLCPRCGTFLDDYPEKHCVYCGWVPKSVYRNQKKLIEND
ncbi:MAG: hypothetical protein MJ170_02800 [Alphaproteobacteria bacterium]|nr:hypothetical protein [Alphaproteobacteria bacterium]